MIKPLPGIVYLKLDEPKAGVLDMTSRGTAVEVAEVLACGDGVSNTDKGLALLRPGVRVYVKSWAIDSIQDGDEKHYFVNVASGGLLAVIT